MVVEAAVKYNPKVKVQPNGFYIVNCRIYPKGLDYVPKQMGNGQYERYPLGKIVMCEIIDEIELRLISSIKNDDSWIPSNYKNFGWFEKSEFVDNVTFF